jgi:hypothetical protein
MEEMRHLHLRKQFINHNRDLVDHVPETIY